MDAAFLDTWMWVIFVGIGLLFILLELFVGLDTGLDLVFIGTAFVLGGLITLPFKIWVVTVIVTAIICVAYVLLGRTYVHNRTAVKLARTNIDTVIGANGIVLEDIKKNSVGRVKIEHQNWRARSEEEINEGEEIIVTGISGTTLSVKKSEEGGDE